VLCGSDVTRSNQALAYWIDGAGLNDVCHLLGERNDVPAVNAAFDVASLTSSYGEAFPNVVGEAMACGVPCVVTDIGDSARIVGDTGHVVAPRDAEGLVHAWLRLLEIDRSKRQELGHTARRRVADRFSIGTVVRSYEEMYERVIRTSKRRTRTRPSIDDGDERAAAVAIGGVRRLD
jgi:glycosyltransferase involved in cell wall biosynthesis